MVAAKKWTQILVQNKVIVRMYLQILVIKKNYVYLI